MHNVLNAFPTQVRADIAGIYDRGGKLDGAGVKRVTEALGTDINGLMVRLVPLAATYARAPISGFKVGAVARGQRLDADGSPSLYLGANIEFPGQALCYSVHAEQSALANAWSNGEQGLAAIAVSAPPCGLCRQFLYELGAGGALDIIFPQAKAARDGYAKMPLEQLLPGAFGPIDLGIAGGLMAPSTSLEQNPLDQQRPVPGAATAGDDPLLREALAAAANSYAPYSGCFSGCALQLANGAVYRGRYAENAAFNPGLLPLNAAISNLVMGAPAGQGGGVVRALLVEIIAVETPAAVSHREAARNVLASFAPGVELEYCRFA